MILCFKNGSAKKKNKRKRNGPAKKAAKPAARKTASKTGRPLSSTARKAASTCALPSAADEEDHTVSFCI